MTIEKLLNTNVNEHTEKKGNLTYLSWAWAWAEALKADPAATFKVEMFEGKPFVDINGTAMVFVTVTVFGKPMTCQLPVMDFKNKAIQKPDAFAVNTAIMRCMTKALSLHGLGLYIYAGEDLPETDEGVRKKGDAPVVTPRGGIGDDLSDDVKSFLMDLATQCMDLVNEGRNEDAHELLEEQNLDPDQKIWLWNQMSPAVRSKIKAAKGK
jgi:hypothetical protein